MWQRIIRSSLNGAGQRCFSSAPKMHGTTILCVRKEGKVVCTLFFYELFSSFDQLFEYDIIRAQCVIGDGQVSLGHTIVKPNAQKVRRINENVVAGFAGSTADAFTLIERLENKLEEYPGTF